MYQRNTELITGIIVGAGHRGIAYASYAEQHPDEFKIVGIADPWEQRRNQVAQRFGIPPERRYESADALAAAPKFADIAINATMDALHVPTTLPLLAAGYDVLLEKPFAVNENELRQLVQATRTFKRKVVICHLLRYIPFYVAIREKILEGAIGDILNIQTIEHVSYHHIAVAYLRGKWRSKKIGGSSMLMAKCCHDLDLIAWLKSGIAPTAVSSFGSNFQFSPEKAPKGSGKRCMVDCQIEADCLYSARKHYIDHPDRWAFYAWESLEHLENPGIEDKIRSLKTDNPYGKCVWKCDHDVVDHQSVIIEFEDGSTASHNMIGGTAKPSRAIHLIGTRGEIQGSLDENKFILRGIDPRPGKEYTETVIDLNLDRDAAGSNDGHAGGDMRLVADFLHVINGEPYSICTTHLEDSINGHIIGFYADKAMEQQCVLAIPKID
ncbi:Gfo/Idh/MocA family oxidoreductase [candidate division KSB1 bacterium]|nr:Gfo/Idh/MocA family oxidoreductase [candidate division KSB1 bacterium]